MLRKNLIGSICLLGLLSFLLATFIQQKSQDEKVSFIMPTGEIGHIIISIPHQPWAGDHYSVNARVEFANLGDSLLDTLLVAKLETSIEEFQPRGEIRLKLNSDHPVTFEWRVKAFRDVTYPGTLWLWLDKNGEKRLLLAREFSFLPQFCLGIRILTLRMLLILMISAILLYHGILLLLCLLRKRKSRKISEDFE